IYLEQNLREFLESIQSRESMIQELHVLSTQPHYENKIELEILKKLRKPQSTKTDQELEEEEEKLRQQLGSPISTKETPIPVSATNTKQKFTNLHSHQIRPNLNYYLLHAKDKDAEIPNKIFREKLKELFDGIDTRQTRFVCLFHILP